MNTGWFASALGQSGWENVPFRSERRRGYRKWNHVTKADLYAIDEMLRAEKKDREGIDSPWVRLANAVILQAAEDWRDAKKKLRSSPQNEEASKTLAETEGFFLSEYFIGLSPCSGSTLLKRLKEETS